MEEHQAHVALRGMTVKLDLEAQGLAGMRQVAVIGQLAAEQAIDALALVQSVHSEPGDQHQIRLARFDQDAGRQMADVEIVVIPADIGLGPDRAHAHAVRRGVDARHAIGPSSSGGCGMRTCRT